MSIITKHTVSVPLDLTSQPPAGSVAIWDGDRFKMSSSPERYTIVSNSAALESPSTALIYIGGDPGGFSQNLWSISATSSIFASASTCFTRLNRDASEFRVSGNLIADGSINGSICLLYIPSANLCDENYSNEINFSTIRESFSINNGVSCFNFTASVNLSSGDFIGFGVELDDEHLGFIKFSYSIQDTIL